MKKIVCLLLVAVLCSGMSGCGTALWILQARSSTHVSDRDKQAILEHLEKKYGEKFIIHDIPKSQNESSYSRGANVYLEGKEDDLFYVAIHNKGFIDDYVLRLLPKEQMQSMYEEWIQSIIPSAKVAIRITGFPANDVMYHPNESLQQFISEAGDLSIDVNIMLSETMLESKDGVFEKLSKIPETEPISGYWSTCYAIGFFMQNAFESIISGEYKYISDLAMSISYDFYDKDLVATTYFMWIKEKDTPNEVMEEMNRNFETKEGI